MIGLDGHVLLMSKFTMLFYLLGWAGLALILLFTINAAFSGTRLGLCWMMLEERYEEFRKEIRDPYPSIGEKAVGRLVKIISFVSYGQNRYVAYSMQCCSQMNPTNPA